MIGSSKNNREIYPRKCFWAQEKETRVKFNPGLSTNLLSNNWALRKNMNPKHETVDMDAKRCTYRYTKQQVGFHEAAFGTSSQN